MRPPNSTAPLFERIAPRFIKIIGNLVHRTPGGGIATDMADYITISDNIVHNNAYLNTLSPELDWSQIVTRVTNNARVLNSIIATDGEERVNENDRNTNIRYDYNLYFGGRKPDIMGPNDIIADPKFVNVTGKGQRDFRLQPGSLAIDSALPFPVIAKDASGSLRVIGKAPDRGAFESSGETSGEPAGK